MFLENPTFWFRLLRVRVIKNQSCERRICYDAEQTRLQEARMKQAHWKKWRPCLSERQWRTVREDQSKSEDSWNYFTYDQVRSRAYSGGEDSLTGISDDQRLLYLSL